ncbi:MAG: ABC transporter permease [Candidatus Brocadiia bacterium]|nr:MAG: ABC transporter permease [Candidatus Brocadiia bacterium]
MQTIIGSIGRQTLHSFNQIVTLFTLAYNILRLIIFPPKSGMAMVRRNTLEQIYFTAVQALPIILPIAILIGVMIIVQFSKFSGQYDLGKITVLIIVRELGPIITAFLIILRSATAVTIEISYMNVFNEMDALEMSGLDPLCVICVPRLVGITSAILCLFIVFDIVAIVGGYAVVWIITYIYLGDYLLQIANAISVADITVGIIKAILFGITIAVTCLYHGFRTQRHITQIPVAASKASVQCFIYCLSISAFISVLFYL